MEIINMTTVESRIKNLLYISLLNLENNNLKKMDYFEISEYKLKHILQLVTQQTMYSQAPLHH